MLTMTTETEVPTLPTVGQILNEIKVLRYVQALVQRVENKREISDLILDRLEQAELLQGS